MAPPGGRIESHRVAPAVAEELTGVLAGDDVHHATSRDARVGREEVPLAEFFECDVSIQATLLFVDRKYVHVRLRLERAHESNPVLDPSLYEVVAQHAGVVSTIRMNMQVKCVTFFA